MPEKFVYQKSPKEQQPAAQTSREHIKQVMSAARAAGLPQPVAPKFREWLGAFREATTSDDARKKLGMSLAIDPKHVEALLSLIKDESIQGDHKMISALTRELRLYGAERKEILTQAEVGAAQVKKSDGGWYMANRAHEAYELVKIESKERRQDLAFLVNRLAKIEQRIEPVFDTTTDKENQFSIQQKNAYHQLSKLLSSTQSFARDFFSDRYVDQLHMRYEAEYRPLFDALESLRHEKKEALARLRIDIALESTENALEAEKKEIDLKEKEIAGITFSEHTKIVTSAPSKPVQYGSIHSFSRSLPERPRESRIVQSGIEIMETVSQNTENALKELEEQVLKTRMQDGRAMTSAIADCRQVVKDLSFFGMLEKYRSASDRSSLGFSFENAITTSLPKIDERKPRALDKTARVKDLLHQVGFVEFVRTENEERLLAAYKGMLSREYGSESEALTVLFNTLTAHFVQEAIRNGASFEEIASQKQLLIDYVEEVIKKTRETQQRYYGSIEPVLRLLAKGPSLVTADTSLSTPFTVLEQKISAEIERKKTYRGTPTSPHTRTIDKEITTLQSIKDRLSAITKRPGAEYQISKSKLQALERDVRIKKTS